MPHNVAGFTGSRVHGGAGEYRYEKGAMTVHVHPATSGDTWSVSADHQNTGSPGTIATGLTKDEAFQHAYGFMKGLSHADKAHGGFGGLL